MMGVNEVQCVVATKADLSTMLGLMQAFYTGESLAFAAGCVEALRQLFDEPTVGRAVLIQRDGKTVGYFVLTFGFSLEREGRTALLDELYVMPEARGRGMGKVAVAAAIAMARETGCRALHLEVDRKNERVRRLYAGVGF